MTIKIDCHLHLAGTGSSCSGCWIHPDLKKRHTIFLLRMLHRISERQMEEELDFMWGEKLSRLVSESTLDYGVALGFDGAATPDGQRDLEHSQLIIPSEWVFRLCKTWPNLLPGPSINPHLRDSLNTLEYCIENKAVLIKWLPSAQLINPSHIYLKPFYRRLADAGIPLLIHCGGERTFKSFDPELNQVHHLLAPLDEGVRVICAHSATRVLGSDDPDQLPLLLQLLEKYPDLWVDNSGICNPSRYAHLPSLAKNSLICSRTLYGSDWPVPSNAFYYLREMGIRKVVAFEREKNWLSRDVGIKRFFGYDDDTLTRAFRVLANLDHWIRPRSDQ